MFDSRIHTQKCESCANDKQMCCFVCGVGKNGEREYYKSKPMTNADKIRSMSSKELADFIANACDHICKGTSCPLMRQNGISCEDRILEWLGQEVE